VARLGNSLSAVTLDQRIGYGQRLVISKTGTVAFPDKECDCGLRQPPDNIESRHSSSRVWPAWATWLIGSVDWYIVGALLLGSLSIASHMAARISDRFLLPVLASILALIGLRLVSS
jgi:hypothetical protein